MSVINWEGAVSFSEDILLRRLTAKRSASFLSTPTADALGVPVKLVARPDADLRFVGHVLRTRPLLQPHRGEGLAPYPGQGLPVEWSLLKRISHAGSMRPQKTPSVIVSRICHIPLPPRKKKKHFRTQQKQTADELPSSSTIYPIYTIGISGVLTIEVVGKNMQILAPTNTHQINRIFFTISTTQLDDFC